MTVSPASQAAKAALAENDSATAAAAAVKYFMVSSQVNRFARSETDSISRWLKNKELSSFLRRMLKYIQHILPQCTVSAVMAT
jgi:hypothetical protein